MDPQVLLLGQDLYALRKVSSIFNVEEEKTFRKSKLITNNYVLNVDNEDDFFTPDNQGSIFNGANWRYSELEIIDENGIEIWRGILWDIVRKHEGKKARLIFKNSYFQYGNNAIVYTSADWETPASAFKNICDQIGFTEYNQKSVTTSDSLFDDNNCFIKIDYTQADGIKFIEAIQKIADFSNSDLYVHLDELYFVHWTPFTGGVKFEIDVDKKGVDASNKVKIAPTVDSPESTLINDYSIDYYDSSGTPATDSANNNIGSLSRSKFGTHSLSEFRTGAGNQIVFKDKTSAVYMGESFIRESHVGDLARTPNIKQRCQLSLFSDHKDLITLGTFVRMNFSDENWSNKIYEVFKFKINREKDQIDLLLFEVNE